MSGYMCKAKRLDNQEWIKGYYVKDDHDYIVENLNMKVRGTPELTNAHVIITETLCRCSGEYDRHGYEISEGDIVEYLGVVRYIVKYGCFEGAVGLGYYYGVGFFLERAGHPEHRVPISPISIEKEDYTVIGNIYDNEEMLQVED